MIRRHVFPKPDPPIDPMPPLDPPAAEGVEVRVPVTRSEGALIFAAATVAGMSVAEWCRDVLRKAATTAASYDPSAG